MNQPETFSNTTPPPPPAAASAVQTQVAVADPRVKSPAVACCLSLMPGLGQVYVGYYQRGFLHVLVVAGLIALLATNDLGPLTPLVAIFMAFFWLYNMIDAARRATLYNQVLAGGSDVPLPDDFSTPSFGGSVAGGMSFVVAGVVLLLNTRFDMSLEWIEDWWPAALIVFGGYLVYRASQDKAASSSEIDEI